MGKPTGFKEWHRDLPDRRPVRERIHDWKEVYLPVVDEHSRQQAGRCMDCGVPFCQQGCPLGNHIPDWNHLVWTGRWREAFARLSATNNFPEFTGRLCPAPCEAACTLAITTEPVTIEEMEKEIVERAFAEGWVGPRPPRQRSGFHVAVIGSGPAGLAAAAQLNSAGHRVTVFEKADHVGGLLRYGIPDFKMEKWVIDRRVEIMKDEGIQFVTGADVGGAIKWSELRDRHDALVIAIGAGRPRDLDVPGRELDGICFAMDYLTRQNRLVAGEADIAPDLDAAGKRVIILGGGDTGSDCLGTAHRQGARSVTQIELLPRPPGERAGDNPWPQWPLVFRTSSSQEEGGEREFAMMTRKLTGDDGALTTLHGVRVRPRAGAPGFDDVPGSELTLPVDLLILAMGFTGPDARALSDQLGVQLDARGNVATRDFASTVPGVFAAGDAQRGQSLIVWAISDGREAARHVDAYLRSDQTWLPTRGADYAFGGR
ncbi:MAG TPA: glutamate synthase subunit beta [Kofleriaceae bacterium]|nr:glutamate synthase subunit beta [Kofleriaceae bacterium]